MKEVKVEEDCIILDIPEGLRLNLLGLIVQIDRILITADRAGLLGGLLASLTCGGAGAADQLDALAQMVRARETASAEPGQGEDQAADEEPAQEEDQAADEEPAQDEDQAADEEPAQDEDQAADEEPAQEEDQAADEEPAQEEDQAADEEPAQDEDQAADEEPAQPRTRRARAGGARR
jgi:hypothetical protein